VLPRSQLRIAYGPGSITLSSFSPSRMLSCGLLTGQDRLHSHRSVRRGCSVADCLRARIDYTRLGLYNALYKVADCLRARIDYTEPHPLDRQLALRIAYGPGSITLSLVSLPRKRRLRIAYGPGSITLHEHRGGGLNMLRIAYGPGSITLGRPPGRLPS